jgi:hypothetical protein
MNIKELALNPLGHRVVALFFPQNRKECNFHRFCKVLAHFQPTRNDTEDDEFNSARSKAKLIFDVFDKNHSGKITASEVLEILRFMVKLNYISGLKLLCNQEICLFVDMLCLTLENKQNVYFACKQMKGLKDSN